MRCVVTGKRSSVCAPDGAVAAPRFSLGKVHGKQTVMHKGPGLQKELANITALRAKRKRLKAEGSPSLVFLRPKVQPGAFPGVFYTQRVLWDDGAESRRPSQRA